MGSTPTPLRQHGALSAMSEVRARPPSLDALLGQAGFAALAAEFGRTATRDDLALRVRGEVA